MEKKEIIIDGVDVSECKHYDDICYEEDVFPLNCKDNDCMYKQLKRLEQENKQLKEIIDCLLKIQYALADSCKQKETALEEIREIVKKEQTDIKQIYNRKNNKRMSEIQTIITEAIGE